MLNTSKLVNTFRQHSLEIVKVNKRGRDERFARIFEYDYLVYFFSRPAITSCVVA